MSKLMFSLWLVFLAVPASAQASCPWDASQGLVVTHNMTSVTVNGVIYPVRGGAARAQFASILHQCNASQAAMSFEKWRSNRRWTNVTAGVGLFLFWPALLATPFTAIAAGTHAKNTVSAITASAAK